MRKEFRDQASAPFEVDEMPPRSRLFSIPPYGLGTWQVESLPSFIKRLAEAHAVPMCRMKQLALGTHLRKPETPMSKPKLAQIWWNGIGGIGHLTRAWVDGLNPLLHSSRISETTLLGLDGRVAMRGLLSRTSRYCPDCDRIDRSNGRHYRYLIWEIDAVKLCPFHCCPLEEMTKLIQYRRARWRLVEPQEPAPNPVIARGDSVFAGDQATEMKRAKLVMELLESPSFRAGLPSGPQSNVATFLNNAARRLMDGVASHLAKHLHTGKGGLHGWMTGVHLPSFGQVIDISQALNCSIESVLTGDGSQLPMILPDYSRSKLREQRIFHDVKGPQFRATFVKLIGEKEHIQTPPSLEAIARKLGVDRSQISNAYPGIAREVSKKHQEWRSRLASLSRSIRHHAYREAAISIAKDGQVPTQNRIMNLLSNVSIFSTIDREACNMICLEVRREFRIQCRR